MLAASVAEVAACLVRVPTEVLKSRFQAGVYGRDISVLGAIGRILAREGARGMWKGYGTTVAREVRSKSMVVSLSNVVFSKLMFHPLLPPRFHSHAFNSLYTSASSWSSSTNIAKLTH